MGINKELIAPCGLYCGVCGIYYATRHNDQNLKEKLAKAYGIKPEDVNCSGCLSDNVVMFCQMCKIKSCAVEKSYEGCYECSDFPCKHIEAFPVPEGKKQILKTVPRWKELGTEKWIAETESLVSCKSCSHVMFRGAKKCRSCGSLLE